MIKDYMTLACFLWFFLSAPLLAQGPSYTMEEAIDYAIEQNRQIDLKKLAIKDADAQILEYWAIGIPKVNGTVNYQHYVNLPITLLPADAFPPGGGPPPMGDFIEVQFGTKNNLQAQLELNTLLFDGSFFVGLKAQQMYKDLRQKELKQTKTEVEYNVTKAFLNVLVAEKNLEILRDNIKNLESNVEEVRASYEAGFAEKLDVDRLELSLRQLQTQLESVEVNAVIAKNLLKFQMGYPMNDPIEIAGDLEATFQADLVKSVDTEARVEIENRPEYDVAMQGLELNEVDIRRTKATYLPSINGFARHSESLQRNDLFDENAAGWLPATIVGAGLNWQIFAGMDRKAKLQRAKIAKERSLKQVSQLEQSIKMEVQNARLQYNIAQRQLNDANQNLDLANEIYETTMTKFEEGVGSSIEVKQAESDYYNAQASYINKLYDLLIAYTDLRKANGTL